MVQLRSVINQIFIINDPTGISSIFVCSVACVSLFVDLSGGFPVDDGDKINQDRDENQSK